MQHQQSAPVAPTARAAEGVSSPVVTNSHRSALNKLRKAFAQTRPVAIVIGEWKSGASFLVDRFLAERKGDVAALRITIPRSEHDSAMREVAQAIGFDLQDDRSFNFENEIKNFLAYQNHNNRRTVICFEEIQHDARRVFDIALQLIKLETKERFGLMLILSGPPSLSKLLNEPPFDGIRAYAEQRIELGPFTLAETREHISLGVEAAGISDISQVFEFDAITRIHEICAGVPHHVDNLCCKCIQMAAKEDNSPITVDLAKKAARLLRQELMAPSSNSQEESTRVNGANVPIGRLIARMHGVLVKEQTLNHGHILIGRSRLCDITVTHPLVSRHHALVVKSATGVSLVDLGSTNGTFVDGRQIAQRTLQIGDVITIGDCTIAYVSGDDRHI